MSTNNEFHTEVIWGQSPDPIFFKMQQNVPLKALAYLKETRRVGEKYEYEYNVSNFVSVETLINTRQFNMRLFLLLLKNLDALTLQLEQYMLSIDMFIYREDALYFDPSVDQFVWLLLPFNRAEQHVKRQQLYFFRHLLMELEQCHSINMNMLLLKSNFSIAELQAQYLSHVNAAVPSNNQAKQRKGKVEQFKSDLYAKWPFKKNIRKRQSHQSVKHSESPQGGLNLKKTAYVQRHPILISRDQPSVQYKIYYETCLIGRDERCEVSIDETSISREHARLYTQNATFLIEDLNSTNGTFVNNKKILNKTVISHGDELRIGHCDFIFLT
ncbi:FHA domain-containing protein [Fusibacter ferrireducens]|uniref:FHA domain-containing protein n=1 Tax=Fusibacter ferrireducens TaxID=2785058 RepID=A0ABR9ZN08_9FIRM|nr:FHA domain-containing protein [Fusibacter ferrireducens]MBF4691853.1 FHA domain-containing protein [Fusibacter ferrireducens]